MLRHAAMAAFVMVGALENLIFIADAFRRAGSPLRWRSGKPSVQPGRSLVAGAGWPHRARRVWAGRPIDCQQAGYAGRGGHSSGGRGGRVDAGLEGVADQLGAAAGAGLVPDPLQMRSHRVDRQEQPLGDLGVGRAPASSATISRSRSDSGPAEPSAAAWPATWVRFTSAAAGSGPRTAGPSGRTTRPDPHQSSEAHPACRRPSRRAAPPDLGIRRLTQP
jgi:hypothetical protein